MEPKKINWLNCDWKESRPGIVSKCFQGAENVTVSVAKVYPGHEQRPHSHVYEQIVFIMDGECDFMVDGKAYPMSKGCLMAIPGNVEHYIIAKGDGPCWNMDIFAPKRPDRVESVENK